MEYNLDIYLNQTEQLMQIMALNCKECAFEYSQEWIEYCLVEGLGKKSLL